MNQLVTIEMPPTALALITLANTELGATKGFRGNGEECRDQTGLLVRRRNPV